MAMGTFRWRARLIHPEVQAQIAAVRIHESKQDE